MKTTTEQTKETEYYISNIRKGNGERSIYTYAELRETETHELVISSTLDYIQKAIKERGYKLSEPITNVYETVEEAALNVLVTKLTKACVRK